MILLVFELACALHNANVVVPWRYSMSRPVPADAQDAIDVLIVEDDDDERELLAMLLERNGLDVKMARSVTDALSVMERRHFNVILADYDLPDGTGTELLREAKRRGILNGARAVLCTAQMYPKRDPEVGLLRKPLDLGRLLSETKREV